MTATTPDAVPAFPAPVSRGVAAADASSPGAIRHRSTSRGMSHDAEHLAAPRRAGALPGVSSALALSVFGGALATIAFDVWGQVVSPGVLGWSALAPVPLAVRTLEVLFGLRSQAAGHAMHLFIVGLLAYPQGYLMIFRPLQERVVALPAWFAGSLYGFSLFLVAIGLLAGPLLAGNPWFLGFGNITLVALIGHVLYGLVLALAVAFLERRGV